MNIPVKGIFLTGEYSGNGNLFSGAIRSDVKPENADQLLTANLRIALQQRGAKARLAKLCGVKPNTVTNWAQGNYSPSVSQLGKIAAALGVTVPDLFAERNEERDLPRQASTGVSASEGNSGGSHDADTAGLVELARQAALFEGKKEALGLIADAIADEIERLDRESRTAHSNAARPHLARRKSR